MRRAVARGARNATPSAGRQAVSGVGAIEGVFERVRQRSPLIRGGWNGPSDVDPGVVASLLPRRRRSSVGNPDRLDVQRASDRHAAHTSHWAWARRAGQPGVVRQRAVWYSSRRWTPRLQTCVAPVRRPGSTALPTSQRRSWATPTRGGRFSRTAHHSEAVCPGSMKRCSDSLSQGSAPIKNDPDGTLVQFYPDLSGAGTFRIFMSANPGALPFIPPSTLGTFYTNGPYDSLSWNPSVTARAVPEPASMALVGMSLLAEAIRRRRTRTNARRPT